MTFKKILFFTLPLFYGFLISAQTEITGIWQGNLGKDGKDLIVDFEISKNGELYTTTMSCAAQEMRDMTTTETQFSGDTVIVTVNRLAGKLIGKYNENGDSIKGTWQQEQIVVPLTLRRVRQKYQLSRPQTPIGPFPYDTISLKIRNEKAEISLDGLLTLPQGNGPFPAVVMISGSGPQNKDEKLMGHQPFLVISDFLARNGIASLRYDDRGFGKSEGVFHTATTYDFADDAEAVLEALCKRKEIDKTKVGILGHSEGGMIAPVIANRNEKVKFLILLAGPAVDISELMITQNKMVFKSFGMDSVQIAANEIFNRKMYQIINQDIEQEMIYDTLRKTCYTYYNSISEDFKKFFGQSKEMHYFSLSSQLLSPWSRVFFRFKPQDHLSQVNIPILALFGGKDIQVDGDQNAEAIRNVLKPATKVSSEVIVYPGLNHLFQQAETGEITEYLEIETTITPMVLEKIASWINHLSENE